MRRAGERRGARAQVVRTRGEIGARASPEVASPNREITLLRLTLSVMRRADLSRWAKAALSAASPSPSRGGGQVLFSAPFVRAGKRVKGEESRRAAGNAARPAPTFSSTCMDRRLPLGLATLCSRERRAQPTFRDRSSAFCGGGELAARDPFAALRRGWCCSRALPLSRSGRRARTFRRTVRTVRCTQRTNGALSRAMWHRPRRDLLKSRTSGSSSSGLCPGAERARSHSQGHAGRRQRLEVQERSSTGTLTRRPAVLLRGRALTSQQLLGRTSPRAKVVVWCRDADCRPRARRSAAPASWTPRECAARTCSAVASTRCADGPVGGRPGLWLYITPVLATLSSKFVSSNG